MPTVRPRSYKRPSSSSYGPTLTLAAFIVLCVVGVWKLTSNSVRIPSQTTARVSSDSNTGRKDKHVFDDNNGDVPDDVAKVDDQMPVKGSDADGNSQEEKKPEELSVELKDVDENALGSTKEEKESAKNSGGDDKAKEESLNAEENTSNLEVKESSVETNNQRAGENKVLEDGLFNQDQGEQQTVQGASDIEDNQKRNEQDSNEDQEAVGRKDKEQTSSTLHSKGDHGFGKERDAEQKSSSSESKRDYGAGKEKNEEQASSFSESSGDQGSGNENDELEHTSSSTESTGDEGTGKEKDELDRTFSSSKSKEEHGASKEKDELEQTSLSSKSKGEHGVSNEKDELEQTSSSSGTSGKSQDDTGKETGEDQHDSIGQKQEKNEGEDKLVDSKKQTSQTEKQEDALMRQRQEDAGIVQDNAQQTENETIGGGKKHQKMPHNTINDDNHQNASGHHEFQDETSPDIKSNKMSHHEKALEDNQESQITTGKGSQKEHQHHKGTSSETSADNKSSESDTVDSHSEKKNEEISSESMASENTWSSQASESKNEKERRSGEKEDTKPQSWQLCNVTAGADYIPCLDNEKALKHVRITGHYEHRERHCPEQPPRCLVPLPMGYKKPVPWPTSRDKIWYNNVPHPMLADVKGHQNWVKVTGEFLTFPGGGTQFIHGALHYIQFVEESEPKIAWGKHTRLVLDVGCGVASFGGFLFEKDVLAMSFAPKDEHEAQVQFALERGIPAISAVMGSQRLSFPSMVFDLVHCARCRVPWEREGGLLLLELNRVLRPGGYFVWSATPVYQKLKEDVEIWKAMESLTKAMCWKLVTITKDKLNSVGAAIYQKPSSNECYDKREQNSPPMCEKDDDPNAAWHIPLQACMHRVPENAAERGSHWPEEWPRRLQAPPYWLNNSQKGIYGKPASQDFAADSENWKELVKETYMSKLGINWISIRNAMDMRSVYGGFAAALKDQKLWVMNVVNIDSADTLPIIYERGLFGMYHDWCESFSTYPRSYDLLHADNLLSRLKKRCKIIDPVIVEVDRIVRPGGILIVRDESDTIKEVENLLKSLHWKILSNLSKDQYRILSAEKSFWRPKTYAASS